MSETAAVPQLPSFVPVRALDPDVIERFAASVPAEVVEIWRRDGVGLFADGYLRVIDPSAFADVVSESLPAYEGAIPVFATAFGDLLFWHDGYLRIARFRHGVVDVAGRNIAVFARMAGDATYLIGQLYSAPYEEARDALGEPDIDECFGYVPLLALGGPETADHLRRVKLREHLAVITAAVGPLE